MGWVKPLMRVGHGTSGSGLLVDDSLNPVTNQSDVNLTVTQHALLTDPAELHQPFHFEQNTDPGAVGAGKWWYDTQSGTTRGLIVRSLGGPGGNIELLVRRGLCGSPALKRRNSTDTGWNRVLSER